MRKYDLMYGRLGNGVTVYDRAHKDYPTIAHISEGGNVKYYEDVPQDVKADIDRHAASIKEKFQADFCNLPRLRQYEIILDNCSITKSLEYHGKEFEEIRADYFTYC